MPMLSRLRSFLRNLTGRPADTDLDGEVRAYVEMLADEKVRLGMAPAEARRAASIELGGIEQVKEQVREARTGAWLDSLLQDVRYGARVLRKAPGFTAIAVLTIALGIGATTGIFSVVDATLLRPLPYPHPEQLVSIEDDLPGSGSENVGLSVPEWHDLQRSGIFQYVTPIGGGDVNLTGSSQPERVLFLAIAPNYISLVGVMPQLGRAFDPQDQTPGFTLEALISDGLWKRAFAADPNIIGKSLRLDNDLYRVIGVMPPGYHDPGRTTEERNIEVWLAGGFSAPPAPPPQRSARSFPRTIARITSGLTMAQAQSRVDALVATLQKQFPEDYPLQDAWRVRLVPLKETIVGNVRQSLILLLGAVALVLLIGCVNVANLLLARASARGREMAIRQALGAPRKRLVRQLLTESLLLSVVGGIAGVAILFVTKAFLLRILPDNLPRLNEISVNWAVLLFAVVASFAAGAVFGLAPALHAGRLDLNQALRQEGRGSAGSGEQTRTRRALVVTEFALSLVLMIAAGLLLRSFADLLNVPLGFNPRNVTAVRTWLPIPNDPATDIYGTPAQEAPFLREVLRRTRTLPGVEEGAVGDLAAIPLRDSHNDLNPVGVVLEGRDSRSSEPLLVDRSTVTPGYFHLVGMTVLRGRSFTGLDNETAPPVALINEAFARTYFPSVDPLGKRLRTPPRNKDWVTVVGVLADARTESLSEAAVPQIYLCAFQRRPKDLAVFLRGRLDLGAIAAEVREQVQSIDPQLPVFKAQTLDEMVSTSLAQRRFSMEMLALFALTALLLAGMGIYGVLSYVVGERTHEIGIRFALGAQRQSILRMVLRQGLGLAVTGAAVGLVCALILSRLMAGLLFGVRPIPSHSPVWPCCLSVSLHLPATFRRGAQFASTP